MTPEQLKRFLASKNSMLEAVGADHRFMYDDRGDRAMIAHAERPYVGDRRTFHGKLGKVKVKSLTLRDVGDCMARAMAQMKPDGTREEFIFKALRNVEKMMSSDRKFGEA